MNWKNLLLATLMMTAPLQVTAAKAKLHFEFDQLGPMKGQHFEGWNIVDGKALSTGRFSIGKDGKVYLVTAEGKAVKKVGKAGKASFEVPASHKKSTLFVLTIEPNNDKDMGPSSVHIIGGSYSSQKANLTIDHGSSLGTDFLEARGGQMLAAPTGGDFNQGIWFMNPNRGEASLDLPTLPAGWVYEGWIVNTSNDKKLSTGLFLTGEGADSDNAGILAGQLKLNFPKFPGQDIVRTPIKLNDGKHVSVITVEPYPDFDPAPSAIKILRGDISTTAKAMEFSEMVNISSKNMPSGKATIQ